MNSLCQYNQETNNLVLRDIVKDDFNNLKKIYTDKSVIKYLGLIDFSDDWISERLLSMIEYRQYNLQLTTAICDKRTNEFMGFFRIDFFPNSYNPSRLSTVGHFQSAYLLEKYQQKGVMSEAFDNLFSHLNQYGIQAVFGEIYTENQPVIKFLKKYDFEFRNDKILFDEFGLAGATLHVNKAGLAGIFKRIK
jgi:RimJ/RimL family protein N-acetyltransferase